MTTPEPCTDEHTQHAGWCDTPHPEDEFCRGEADLIALARAHLRHDEDRVTV